LPTAVPANSARVFFIILFFVTIAISDYSNFTKAYFGKLLCEYYYDTRVESLYLILQKHFAIEIASWCLRRFCWALDGICVKKSIPINTRFLNGFKQQASCVSIIGCSPIKTPFVLSMRWAVFSTLSRFASNDHCAVFFIGWKARPGDDAVLLKNSGTTIALSYRFVNFCHRTAHRTFSERPAWA
jgi:hypothetical protein